MKTHSTLSNGLQHSLREAVEIHQGKKTASRVFKTNYGGSRPESRIAA